MTFLEMYPKLRTRLEPAARKFAGRGFEWEDLMQDALLAVFEAEPSTLDLAVIVGRRRMLSVAKSAGAKKRIPDLFELPVSFDPYPALFAKIATNELRSILSGLDAEVAEAIAQPSTELIRIVQKDLIRKGTQKFKIRAKHIAEYLGTTEPTVRRSLKRLQALGAAA